MHVFTRSEMRVSENCAQLGDYTSVIGRSIVVNRFVFCRKFFVRRHNFVLFSTQADNWAYCRSTSWFSDNLLNKSKVSLYFLSIIYDINTFYLHVRCWFIISKGCWVYLLQLQRLVILFLSYFIWLPIEISSLSIC